MNRRDFQKVIDQTFETVKKLNQMKGGEYSGDQDAFANFKRNAKALNLRSEQVWGVYAGKHWDAVQSFIVNPNRPSSEPIEGRLDDLIVYCILFKGMLKEGLE